MQRPVQWALAAALLAAILATTYFLTHHPVRTEYNCGYYPPGPPHTVVVC